MRSRDWRFCNWPNPTRSTSVVPAPQFKLNCLPFLGELLSKEYALGAIDS